MKTLTTKFAVMLCLAMTTLFAVSCSTDTEKKLAGEWRAAEIDEDGTEYTLYLNLIHESAEGRLALDLDGETVLDMPITWFADNKQMEVTLDMDDMKYEDMDPAEGQLMITRMFGATSSGEAKWRIVKLTDKTLILSISGDEIEFEHL